MRSEEFRASGNGAFKRHEYAEAIALYTQGLQTLSINDAENFAGSERAHLLQDRALSNYRVGDLAAAEADASAALSLDADLRAARHCLALCQLSAFEGRAAEQTLAQAGERPGRGAESTAGASSAQGASEWRALERRARALAEHQALVQSAAGEEEGGSAAPVRRALAALKRELVDDDDVDEGDGGAPSEEARLSIEEALALLQRACQSHPCAKAAFERWKGYELILGACLGGGHSPAAVALLQAAGLTGRPEEEGSPLSSCHAVVWPRLVWARLCKQSLAACDGDATQLLTWAAEKDGWAARHLTMGDAASTPLLRHLAGVLPSLPLTEPGDALVRGALRALLSSAARDPQALRDAKVCVLARCCAVVDTSTGGAGDAASGPLLDPAAEELPPDSQALSEAEQQALKELLQKRKAIFDPGSIRRRRIALLALRSLAEPACAATCASECASPDGKRALKRFAAWVRDLHDRSPSKTVPKRGRDGSVQGYATRRYAAAFDDNVGGDFLLRVVQGREGKPGVAASRPESAPPEPLLPLLCSTLEAILASCPAAAAPLAAGALLEAAGAVLEHAPGSKALQPAAALVRALALASLPIQEEACSGLGSPRILDALASDWARGQRGCAKEKALRARAALALAGAVDGLSGDDCEHASRPGEGAVAGALEALGAEGASASPERLALRTLALRALERAQQQQGLGVGVWPKGGCWGRARPALRRDLLAKEGRTGKEEGAARELSGLVKGFIDRERKETSALTSLRQASTAALATPAAAIEANDRRRGEAPLASPPVEESATDASVADLVDVFDSSPAPLVRQARSAWLQKKAQMEWSQDSTDVTILLRVPRGTKAKELSVAMDSQLIAVRLAWYGSLFEGAPLHAVRAADSRWCLEDDVVRLTLAKAREGQWWKAAVQGGEERTYHQLLHDAVHADERVKPFEELDEDAKGLMESIMERQEYVAAGMLDPEGFDDFRVVIGESSLKG